MVAMNVWPTDASDGSVANEARWRKMARTWAPSGVMSGTGGELAPTLAMPNLTVRSGVCWVDGHFCELISDQVLAATANGLAVVRFDPAANTAELLWRDAITVPAQSPTGTWELAIARTSGSVLIDQRLIYRAQQAANNGVTRFAGAAARVSGVPVPVLNQLTMLDDRAGYVQYWNGSGWVDQAYVPPAIPPETDPRSQYGSSVFTTNIFGGATFPFPTAFGGAPIVNAVNGDWSSGSILFAHDMVYTTTTAAALVAMNSTGGTLNNATVRANWLAIGPR